MSQINILRKKLDIKIVYFGPVKSGKAENLKMIAGKTPEANHGDLLEIVNSTGSSKFLYLYLKFQAMKNLETVCKLFTIPDNHDEATCKLLLHQVDGIIFVADSRTYKFENNVVSWNNLKKYLREYGENIDDMPVVIQWNYRDAPDALPVEVMKKRLNVSNLEGIEAVASQGKGVFPTLKKCISVTMQSLKEKWSNIYPDLFAKEVNHFMPFSYLLEKNEIPSNFEQDKRITDEEWKQWLEATRLLIHYQKNVDNSILSDREKIKSLLLKEDLFFSDFINISIAIEKSYFHYHEIKDLERKMDSLEHELARFENAIKSKYQNLEKQLSIKRNQINSDSILKHNTSLLEKNREILTNMKTILNLRS